MRKCSTCKKKLASDENKYCTICVIRIESDKIRRRNTDYFRPCKECGVDMKNPASNRKWCVECGDKIRTAQQAEQTLIRNAKRKAIRDAERAKGIKPQQRAICSTDRYKNTINPKYLVRGLISNNRNVSMMEGA